MSSDIYDYEERLQRYKRNLKDLRNEELALEFLDHLGALGLSPARVSKYASHLPPLLRVIDFNLAEATRRDVEKVVAWINRQKYREWTKHDKKLSLRKLVQYAKIGSCGRKTPLPPEVSWIDMKVNEEKDARVTPESLIKPKDFGRVVKETENARDEALVYVLFEAALRPGEILMMDIGSVEFKERYCLIAVNGKTGIKRIPLVVSYRPLLKRLMDECKDKGEAIGIWKDTPSECWSGLPPNWCGQAAERLKVNS